MSGRHTKKSDLRVPVFLMKRVAKAIVGKSVGYSRHDAPAKDDHHVTVYFAREDDAKAFYQAISALNPLTPDPENHNG